MSKFLKLVGANTYTLRNVGTVRRNQVIEVDRDEDYERLLSKGEYAEDGHFRPMFVEAPAPKQEARSTPVLDEEEALVSTTTHVAGTGDIRSGAFGGAGPQAPMGEGPNGAENDIDLHEVDTEMDGVKDEAYHGGANDNEPDQDAEGEQSEQEGEGEQSEGETPKATARRQRKPATK